MLRNNIGRLGKILCFLLIMLSAHAQYTVTGGSGTPMLYEDLPNRLQVYLTYGMSNTEIRFSSQSSSHQWFRYKKKALEAEKITSEQQGAVSVVRNPEEGYGYFVEEEGQLPRYVWIIDYSKYVFDIQAVKVAKGDCSGIYLEGDAHMPTLSYFTPRGKEDELERQFDVVYQTLEWSEDSKLFSQKTVQETITGDPFAKLLKAPLCDTEILLKGDLFARHFNVEKSVSTGLYEAIAVRAYADTVLYQEEALNRLSSESGELSAPVEIHFSAYANSPVASLFIWKIYRNEDGPDKPLVRFIGEEVDYTFNQWGNFTAEVEVSDRKSLCSDIQKFDIKIIDSYLDVPNVFSPGTSPGINDEFRVTYKSIVSFKCWIFNRWGVEMYRWTDPAKGWDGKKGGRYVAPGVYFYVIEAKGSDGKSWNRKGSINILRPKDIQDADNKK